MTLPTGCAVDVTDDAARSRIFSDAADRAAVDTAAHGYGGSAAVTLHKADDAARAVLPSVSYGALDRAAVDTAGHFDGSVIITVRQADDAADILGSLDDINVGATAYVDFAASITYIADDAADTICSLDGGAGGGVDGTIAYVDFAASTLYIADDAADILFSIDDGVDADVGADVGAIVYGYFAAIVFYRTDDAAPKVV